MEEMQPNNGSTLAITSGHLNLTLSCRRIVSWVICFTPIRTAMRTAHILPSIHWGVHSECVCIVRLLRQFLPTKQLQMFCNDSQSSSTLLGAVMFKLQTAVDSGKRNTPPSTFIDLQSLLQRLWVEQCDTFFAFFEYQYSNSYIISMVLHSASAEDEYVQ